MRVLALLIVACIGLYTLAMALEPKYLGIRVTANQFEERQRFAVWVYLLVLAILILSTGVLSVERDGFRVTPPFVLYFSVALLIFLFNILALRTTVDSDGLRVRLGRPVPIFWKRIEIESIRQARVVTYRPIVDAGGWGLRFGRFDGVFTIYWNARGNRGVLVETEKRRYVIGSQDPEALCAAIEHVRVEVKRT